MKLPWIKPKTAPRDDLLEQLDAAKTARTLAWSEVEKAQARFDADGAILAEKELIDARGEAERADLHLGRAERLLQAHDQAEADAKRQAAEARIAEITRRLSKPEMDVAQGPLAKREAEVLLRYAEIRTEREVLYQTMKNLVLERYQLQKTFGERAPHPYFDVNELLDFDVNARVVNALLNEARKLNDHDPRREVLSKIIRWNGGSSLPPAKFEDPSTMGGAA